MKVSLFVTCLVDLFFPEVGEATVKVLREHGVEVDFPRGQTCCGQPAFNSGYWDDARAAARHFLDVFEATDDYIVTPSGSCALMVKQEYPHLFENEPETKARAVAVAQRVHELSSFLIDVLGVEEVGARYEGRVTYHASCHLSRGLGVTEPPRRLLQAVDGVEYVEMEDAGRCCGFGGTFAVKMADVSNAMGEDKIANIRATEADTLVGCDAGCLMQITGAMRRSGRPIKAYHLAQILAGETES
ncbi:MAG: Lactate utilization protein A [Anaerolineales bacterium]|nr:Lactate utilization protein A [Anaerolineales bacterium]